MSFSNREDTYPPKALGALARARSYISQEPRRYRENKSLTPSVRSSSQQSLVMSMDDIKPRIRSTPKFTKKAVGEVDRSGP